MYDQKNLSVLAYANGFTLWHYATTDSMYDIFFGGYFNGAGEMLRKGDHIHVFASKDRQHCKGAILSVSNSSDGVVVVDSI